MENKHGPHETPPKKLKPWERPSKLSTTNDRKPFEMEMGRRGTKRKKSMGNFSANNRNRIKEEKNDFEEENDGD